MGQNKISITLELLNNVEVKGKQNLNNLLASIQFLEEVQREGLTSGMDGNHSIDSNSGFIYHSGEANPSTEH